VAREPLADPSWVRGAEAWARFDNSPAPLTLRVNTLRATRDALADALAEAGVRTEPARFASQGLVVTSGNPLLTPLAHSGAFFVQDEASQLVGEFAAASTGERVLDTCASPGGKTTQMAAAMGDTGVIVAADVRGPAARAALAHGQGIGRRRRADRPGQRASRPSFRDIFDLVLVDAPCSGLGTIRRDPDVRWRRTETDLAPLAEAQQAMIAQAASAVRPGGRLGLLDLLQ
jgi:16S rRNA (cytosine967-C5)-methyltransferase